MKYSMVRQFSNASIDNIYKFIFKIVDFGKILYEALWVFFDIWTAFYLIFYNFIMYIYYIFLYLIDWGTEESRTTVLFWKKVPRRVSGSPGVIISNELNPVPASYRITKKVTESAENIAKTVSTAAHGVSSSISSGKITIGTGGAKKPVLKTIYQFFANFFKALKNIIVKPLEFFANFFATKLKPVREGDDETDGSRKSLIDEYLKEYEKKRK